MSNSRETHRDRPNCWRDWCLRICKNCLLIYLVLLLLLSIMQRELMYVPSRATALPVQAERLGIPGFDISTRTTDGLVINGWHLVPPQRDPAVVDAERCLQKDYPVVIFFPGNGGNRQHRDLDFRLLTGLQVNVIAFDYRGYGENPGTPTEANLADDARSIWRYVTAERNVPADRVLLYGESLGGGVATRLAAELSQAGTPPAGLILRSTFSSMVAAAGFHYPWLPVSWVLKDQFRSDIRIASVIAPVLILHGSRDDIVPIEQGRTLFTHAPKIGRGVEKTFVELPRANHNDVLLTEAKRVEAAVAQFLSDVFAQ